MALATDPLHVEGQTEVWVQTLLGFLFRALRRENATIVELGGFQGHTSAHLALALQSMGGGTLIIAEWDPDAPERADLIDERLQTLDIPDVDWRVMRSDALTVIASLADESVDFAYLDDDHTHEHVAAELTALMPKMKLGALVCGHDVHGSCNLQEEFARYPNSISLDLPRLGPAGGLGIIQVV